MKDTAMYKERCYDRGRGNGSEKIGNKREREGDRKRDLD